MYADPTADRRLIEFCLSRLLRTGPRRVGIVRTSSSSTGSLCCEAFRSATVCVGRAAAMHSSRSGRSSVRRLISAAPAGGFTEQPSRSQATRNEALKALGTRSQRPPKRRRTYPVALRSPSKRSASSSSSSAICNRLSEMALLPARSANSRYHAANSRSLSGSGAPIGLFMANVSPPPIRARTNLIRRGAAGKVMVNFERPAELSR